MKKIKDENSKDKILKSAAKLFAQKGFDGVSIREICKDADVNICMVSYYFGGKQELYQGIIDDLIGTGLVMRLRLTVLTGSMRMDATQSRWNLHQA